MKNLIIFALCAMFFAQSAFAQVRQDRTIIRGNVTSIKVKYPADITADSLFLQVRSSSSYTSTKYIEKKNTVAGGSDAQILASYTYPYTTVTIYFSTANTSGLSIANYYYDLRKSVSPDSAVLVYGTFTVASYAGEVVNNITPGSGGLSETAVKGWISDSVSNRIGDLASSKIAMWVITDGTPSLSLAARFDSNPTIAISGDTATISDPSGELNLSGEFDSNDKDYIILSHSAYELKVLFDNGFFGRTTSVWFESRLSGYVTEETDLNIIENLTNYLRKDVFDDSLANYDLLYGSDSTAFRTFSNLKYLDKVDTTAQRTFSDLKYPTKTSMQTVDDSLASDIAENKLTTHFFTGTDSIHYGQDSIVVSHGVGSTPQFISIQLTSDSFGFPIWVNTIGATTFAVKRSDVGLETITSYIKFKWMAYK